MSKPDDQISEPRRPQSDLMINELMNHEPQMQSNVITELPAEEDDVSAQQTQRELALQKVSSEKRSKIIDSDSEEEGSGEKFYQFSDEKSS